MDTLAADGRMFPIIVWQTLSRLATLARVFGGISLVLLMAPGSVETAYADKFNIAAATCEQINDWKSEDKYDVFVFFLGYYGGMTKSAEIDDDVIQTFAKKFEAWCSRHPNAKLLENVRTIFEVP
jgi:hypothetical protein